MQERIYVNNGTQIIEYDTNANLISTRDLVCQHFHGFGLYSSKNILVLNRKKSIFRIEITAIAKGYGLVLAGFKNGDLLHVKEEKTVNLRAKIQKILLFSRYICVATLNEIFYLNHNLEILYKMSSITKDFSFKGFLYVADLNSMRVYDSRMVEVSKMLGRFHAVCVNSVEDIVFLALQNKLIKKQVYGEAKEIEVKEPITGMVLSVDERLLFAWSPARVSIVETDNFVLLKEIKGPTCGLAYEFNGINTEITAKRTSHTSHLPFLKKQKMDDKSAKAQDLKHYVVELKKLNDLLFEELKNRIKMVS